MARILVTGGAGFIGSHVVEALVERGDETCILDNFNDFYDPALKRRNVEAIPDARLVEGDIRDEEGMAQEPAVPYGEPAPDFALPALDGAEVRLADQQGQVVLVDFWATWCGPCKEELPHIETFHRQYGDSGLRVLALSTDMDDDAVQPFIDEHDYTFTVLHADNAVQSDYGVSGIPVVYLVDRQGRVRWHRVGFGPGGEEEMGREIEKLLNEPAEAPAPDAAGDML